MIQYGGVGLVFGDIDTLNATRCFNRSLDSVGRSVMFYSVKPSSIDGLSITNGLSNSNQ